MSDDITFCFNSHCKNKECERNPKNIKTAYKSHSFACFRDCEYWDVPTVYYAVPIVDEQREGVKQDEA